MPASHGTTSERIRTVYPGATSGLYEEGEVASFADPQRAEPIQAETHNAQTGEVIEGHALDVSDTPERERVPGITKIKNNLNKLMRDGRKATDLEAFNALVSGCKDDLQTIKDANHSYWTGEDFEGFKAWIKRRREELTPKVESTALQLLLSLVAECKQFADLQELLEEHDATIATLDGEEARKFEEAYNVREQAILTPVPMTAGAFGG
jgi:hypothetical protein